MDIKKLMQYGAGCLLMLFGAASCSTDDLSGVPGTSFPTEDGLYVSLQVDDKAPVTVATRSAGVDELGENTVSRVDLFLFDGNSTFVKHVPVTDGNTTRACLYSGSNWRNSLTASSYTLYALANYTGETDLSTVTTLDALRALTHTDASILGSSADRTFLMDGKVDFTSADLGTGSVVVLEDGKAIQLRRAAAKVEVTLTIAEGVGFTPTGLSAQVVNYATCTAAFAESNAPADRGLRSMESDTDELVYQPFADGEEAKLRFYAYVNDWTNNLQTETMLLVNIPYEENGTPKDNYYKVPLLPAMTTPQVLERNTHYQITATVNIVGSEEPEEPTPLESARFEIAPWKNDAVTVGDSDSPTYLILSEYLIDIRNTDGYDSLKFYSSSPIKVELASVEDLETAAQEVGFTYPGEGTLAPVFFVNAFNQRMVPDGVDVTATPSSATATTGNISISSPNPDNLTVRYITLKVTNNDNLTRYVIVQQYPLTYITGVQGSYSYLTTYSGGWPRGLSRIEGYTIPQSVRAGLGGHIGNDVDMKSKFYMPNMPYNGVGSPSDPDGELEGVPEYGRIYRIDGSYSDNVRDNEPASNNRMYNVTITATSDEYIISHPVMNGGVVAQTKENNNFVSPSFMLASQLGNADAMTWRAAQQNCQNYVEVDMDGRIYDDWRMPTLAELEIISRYQNSVPETMFEVLETRTERYTEVDEEENENHVAGTYRYNPFYWTAIDGIYLYTGEDGNDQSVYATNRRIRCVRDVKPGENVNNQP